MCRGSDGRSWPATFSVGAFRSGGENGYSLPIASSEDPAMATRRWFTSSVLTLVLALGASAPPAVIAQASATAAAAPSAALELRPNAMLEGGTAAVEARLGKGTVLLVGPEITFRAQPHGTFKFLFNGIFFGASNAAGQ